MHHSGPVISEIILRSNPSQFLFVTSSISIKIDRKTREISQIKNPEFLQKSQLIFGIVGVIHLIKGPYLIVITQRSFIGNFDGNDIYQVENLEMIPFEDRQLTRNEFRDEEYYIQILKKHVFKSRFYYSYTMDITNTCQARHMAGNGLNSKPIWETAKREFWWNYNLMKFFLTPEKSDISPEKLSPFILPLIMGFVGMLDFDLNGKKIQVCLFSRRDVYRPGPRFLVRGIDLLGKVANFVQTEQILIIKNTIKTIYSFVIVRGSIPLFWSQKTNLDYTPEIVVHKKDNHKALNIHFDDLEKDYGSGCITCISLIKLSGPESVIGQAFSQVMSTLNRPNVKYIEFDMHQKCKTGTSKLLQLIKTTENHFEQIKWFKCIEENVGDSTPFKITDYQNGVFRINCIDNLDRTNVAQSIISRYILTKQLEESNMINQGSDNIRTIDGLYNKFRCLWADNGDVLSEQYAGTGALKSDFTKTGIRTFAGMIEDARRSLTRYWMNKMLDGTKLDSLNLFLGIYKIDPNQRSPFLINRRRKKIVSISSTIFLVLLSYGLISLYFNPKYGVIALSSLLFLAYLMKKYYFSWYVNIPSLIINE